MSLTLKIGRAATIGTRTFEHEVDHICIVVAIARFISTLVPHITRYAHVQLRFYIVKIA